MSLDSTSEFTGFSFLSVKENDQHDAITLMNSGFKCSPDIRSTSFKFSSTPTALAAINTVRHGADPGR